MGKIRGNTSLREEEEQLPGSIYSVVEKHHMDDSLNNNIFNFHLFHYIHFSLLSLNFLSHSHYFFLCSVVLLILFFYFYSFSYHLYFLTSIHFPIISVVLRILT